VQGTDALLCTFLSPLQLAAFIMTACVLLLFPFWSSLLLPSLVLLLGFALYS